MNWKLIVENRSGLENMERDFSLFKRNENGENFSALCIYSWSKPCISVGYSQNIEDEIDRNKLKITGYDVVKRPTGGGIVFHNTAEATYSIITSIDNQVLPKGLIPSYKKISSAIVFALNKIGVNAEIRNWKLEIGHWKLDSSLCFSYPTEYEVVCNGKKIVGSAQRRGRKTILQQGSIFVRKSDETFFSVLRKPYNDYNAVSVEDVLDREVSFEELKNALAYGFKKELG